MVGSQGPRRMVDAEPQGLGLVLQDIATSSGVSAGVNSLPTVEPVDRLGDLQEARAGFGPKSLALFCRARRQRRSGC